MTTAWLTGRYWPSSVGVPAVLTLLVAAAWWINRRWQPLDRRGLGDVLASIIDPMVVIDTDGIVVAANQAMERVFQWDREELIGQNVSVLMGEPYRSEHDTYLQNYLRTGEARAIGRVRKVRGRRRNGRDFPAEISISQLEGLTASGRHFIGMVRDVSDREEMTAMLSHAERLAAAGELAASVAHEVNNPVNTILNCVQLHRDGDTDPELIDDIEAEAQRIAEIVSELLDMSRDNRESISSLDLHKIVSKTATLMRRRIMSRGVELSVDVPVGLPLFLGRQQEVQQVLLNLLMNAQDALQQKAPGEPRNLWIRGEVLERDLGRGLEPAGVRLRVRDDGPGIPPETQSRIFEPFFTTKRERGGSGLGLAVSRRIVERYGGTIVLDSEPGAYAEFCIELPAARADAPDQDDGTDLFD